MLIFFIFCSTFYNAQSNFIIAGQNGSIYVDIVPDTFLNALSSYDGGVDQEVYYIDVNQDGVNDIEIGSIYSISPGHVIQDVEVLSLDTSIKFSFFRSDSAYRPSCGGWSNVGNILAPYIVGDTIKNNKYVDNGYLSINNSSCFASFYDTTWLKSYNQFIGIRSVNRSGIQYGWIRVNISGYQKVLIKDFGLGSGDVGIKQNKILNSFSVFPNPANTKIKIELNAEFTEIKITDVSGREILNTYERSIDIGKLNEGIYFVQVKTAEGILTKKIIIQR